jgi:hypothetical protein
MSSLSSREQFIIIVLNKNKKLPNTLDFKLGLVTAYILDLMSDGIIAFDADSTIKIIGQKIENPLCTQIVDTFRDKDPKKLPTWINLLLDFLNDIKKEALNALIDSNVISAEIVKRFLVWKTTRYSITDRDIIDSIIQAIKDTIDTKSLDDKNLLSLISVVYACNFIDPIFDDPQGLERQIEKITRDNKSCCIIIDGINEVKVMLTQFYKTYYYPMY